MRTRKDLEKLQAALLATFEFPYSSAASMYILSGQKPPIHFGSNCYEQARKVKNELIEAGFDQTCYIEDTIIGRHRSILCHAAGRRFIFCPYFMHRELIDIDAINDVRSIHSYPIVNNEHSIVQIKRNGDIVTLTKTWPGQERVDQFSFNLIQCITSDIDFDDYVARALHPEQTTLSIRFLNTNTGEIDHLIYATHANDPSRAVFIKTNDGTKIAQSERVTFDTKLDALTSHIHTSNKEALDFLQRAYTLYAEMALHQPQHPNTPIPFPYKTKTP